MRDVIKFLKEYIWEKGFEKLSKDPFVVYAAMIRDTKNDIDLKTARLVLITLMSKTHEMAKKGCSEDALIRYIQSEHCVNKQTAKDLASMYLALFSDENKKSWDDAKEAGFKEFCQEEWTIEWSGDCRWHTKRGGSYPCNAEASLTFNVQDQEKLHQHLSSALETNPFLSADDIFHVLEEEIESGLDHDLEEYCNADDYYEPYLDEFVGEGTYDSEKQWKAWGLEIVEFTGSGDVDFDI